jgi:hypothetical protein
VIRRSSASEIRSSSGCSLNLRPIVATFPAGPASGILLSAFLLPLVLAPAVGLKLQISPVFLGFAERPDACRA